MPDRVGLTDAEVVRLYTNLAAEYRKDAVALRAMHKPLKAGLSEQRARLCTKMAVAHEKAITSTRPARA